VQCLYKGQAKNKRRAKYQTFNDEDVKELEIGGGRGDFGMGCVCHWLQNEFFF
jgi:hypothetical protein